jgi:hypothetical protein
LSFDGKCFDGKCLDGNPALLAAAFWYILNLLLPAVCPAGIGLFFCAMSVLEGNSLQEAWASTKQKFKPTLMANYLLWPAANLVNFAFVPPAQRILYCNVVYVSSLALLVGMLRSTGLCKFLFWQVCALGPAQGTFKDVVHAVG